MNRIRRSIQSLCTVPARFEVWVEEADPKTFFAACDIAMRCGAVLIVAALFVLFIVLPEVR
jgi:hypothetical protein